MNKKQRGASVSHRMVLALIFLLGASLGCKMLGGGTTDKKGADDPKNKKGIPATQICQMLAHPSFESRYEYDGAGCSGSTYFGAKDTRNASYEPDMRPAFSYAAIGDQGVIKKVILTMSKRADGAQFFVAEAEAVARTINDQPLPKEIESAINGAIPTSGGEFTTTSQIGNAKVELVRSSSDSKFYLSFQF